MNKNNGSDNTQERLISGQGLAVLGTSGSDGPYLSLVAFAPSPDRRAFYFATPRNTRKWSNIVKESRVALMLDDRPVGGSDFSRSAALTITGKAGEMSGEERQAALDIYLARHPELANFVGSPGTVFLKITVSDLYLADGFR